MLRLFYEIPSECPTVWQGPSWAVGLPISLFFIWFIWRKSLQWIN